MALDLKRAIAVVDNANREPQELTSRNNRGADIRAAEVANAQGKKEVWGIAIEFDDTDKLLAAATAIRKAGYTRVDAYTPMPVEGLSEAIGYRNKQMPALMFCGAVLGGCTGYFIQWFANTQSYVLNLGGRPYHTWPNFIVITFEMTILFCALTGVFGMLALNGLPTLYHPIYNAPGFERASQDRFFIAVEARDRNFEYAKTLALLQGLDGLTVTPVEK
ncbi:quinol:cytochrome c oxidoreductase membrane protein [Abditibacterium utsteinense]|uniref:Quinol:cytochrome c oxidoreductase membrane protein n=1 Tax=Abditibacterium utsteinense TaxID=1960156 RepID=A0A2S8SV00_9BACT|nr:DUF3341 domain-containing protein [Abditibacterium utsteinense]PQV64625.1 quinol:cytochrome c oxidoreductase membrane protein [Abditibacterium utsteinense]